MTTNSSDSAPDTIVLIHGLWMTPRCWEHWITYYQARGFKVLAPAYPGLDVEVELQGLRHPPLPVEHPDHGPQAQAAQLDGVAGGHRRRG